jgi:2-keto-3-deoxy-L-rhamnonate aldolase RhmA
VIRGTRRRSIASSPRATHGKAAAFIATDDAWARDYAKKGFRLFAYGLDQLMLQNSLASGLKLLRDTSAR